MKRVFISYDHLDSDFAVRLAKSLNDNGLETYLSGHSPLAGGDWQGALRDQLKDVNLFVLVMPEAKAKSANSAFFEAGVASAFGKGITVVVPDTRRVDQSNIPLDLAGQVYLDAAAQPLQEVASKIAGSVEHAA